MQRVKIVRPGEGECIWVAGNHYTFQAVGDETEGTYTLFEGVVPPGAGPPPHLHRREVEAIYVLEGELAFYVHNERIMLDAGCFIHIPKGVWHAFKNEGPTPARMLDLIAPAGMEKFLQETGRPVTDRTAPPEPMTSEYVEQLRALAPKYEIEIAPSEPKA